MKKLVHLSLIIAAAITILAFNRMPGPSITGAWQLTKGNTESVLIYQDGYFTHTMYNKTDRKFMYSTGGTYSLNGNKIVCKVEFDTKDKESIGSRYSVPYTMNNDKLSLEFDGKPYELNRVDDGTGALAGNWRISGRMQEGKFNSIQRGDRKTLKLLSGTRFQWMAINPASKEFFGTGGGTYTFKDGKYTENIEFFSRDSSRVGATLSFDGSVSGDVWTHKGFSSKGDPLHEEWSREKQ